MATADLFPTLRSLPCAEELKVMQFLIAELAKGNLAPVEARGLLVSAQVGSFDPVQLVFAWSLTDDAPLLLGRMNFSRI